MYVTSLTFTTFYVILNVLLHTLFSIFPVYVLDIRGRGCGAKIMVTRYSFEATVVHCLKQGERHTDRERQTTGETDTQRGGERERMQINIPQVRVPTYFLDKTSVMKIRLHFGWIQ